MAHAVPRIETTVTYM